MDPLMYAHKCGHARALTYIHVQTDQAYVYNHVSHDCGDVCMQVLRNLDYVYIHVRSD